MSKKILLVEDEPDAIRTLANILEKEGYTVIKATVGKEAIELARKEMPDLVLTDTVLLDDFGGIELCRQIKQVEKINTKVIIYTAKIDAIDATKARENGTDDYCVKGTDPSLLIEAVKRII